MTATDDLKAERDALGFIGVLAHAYLTWDPAIPAGQDAHGKPDFTHFAGLNIHALIVDNRDGEVLAIERNMIHETEDPTRHAEQGAIRAALARLRMKYPRSPGVSVEQYYRSLLFYAPGAGPGDFATKGCTLYTTLEPCPMCTTTVCVCRMKRTVFVIADKKFGGLFPSVKEQFYRSHDLAYESFVAGGGLKAATLAHSILDAVGPAIEQMRKDSVQDTWFLDRVHQQLGSALDALVTLKDTDIGAPAEYRAFNARTLNDLKRLCRLPG